ncbi:hypothetical protein LSTR_LSTR012787 [Laodelphax striatellus]|uniref:Uncharacterized protein n=1 Tax=Laodelphax striatellus TaxID=195883 RepID=A0A482WXS0_LAOST|nr:hypothetical protein LSTR_LSTR012787 [Laodelphax striatellus]
MLVGLHAVHQVQWREKGLALTGVAVALKAESCANEWRSIQSASVCLRVRCGAVRSRYCVECAGARACVCVLSFV